MLKIRKLFSAASQFFQILLSAKCCMKKDPIMNQVQISNETQMGKVDYTK